MANPQLTLVQIDNYGPWTVTPEPRREADLQALQARLYADLAEQFGTRDAYVFYTRFDNMIAVTNGVGMDDHARIQESIANRYPVTVSMAVAHAPTPADALAEASARLQDAGGAQDGSRRSALRGEALADEERGDDDVHVAHFDVVDATRKYTDRGDAFDTFLRIERGYVALAEHMHSVDDALTFFVGGDNAIAIATDLVADDYAAALDHVADVADIEFQVGAGRGRCPQEAGMAAKHALEKCRDDGSRVEGPVPVSGAD